MQKREKLEKEGKLVVSKSYTSFVYIYILDEEKKVMKNRHNSGKGKQQ